MATFNIHLSDKEYALFKASVHTRLYVHTRSASGTLTITTNKPYQLASDLEKVVDFGATSAVEVFNLPPRYLNLTINEIVNKMKR